MKKNTDKHHIVPESRWWRSVPENLKETKIDFHRAFHRVFSNAMPHEQVLFLLDFNWNVLRQEFKNDVIHLLTEKERDFFYKKWIFKT